MRARRAAVVAIGEQARVAGFALVGVAVRFADNPQDVRVAFDDVGEAAALLLVTPAAAAALASVPATADGPLVCVLAEPA